MTCIRGDMDRGSTQISVLFRKKNLSFNDNGVTGPDWGHSELVFGCFLQRCFQHAQKRFLPLLRASLSAALPQLTRLFCVLSYCLFSCLPYLPQQYLYFLPLPQGQGSLRPIFLPTMTVPDFFCSKYSRFFVSASYI